MSKYVPYDQDIIQPNKRGKAKTHTTDERALLSRCKERRKYSE